MTVEGEAGDEWTLAKEVEGWRLYQGTSANAVCRVRFDQDAAWRLMAKGLSREEAVKRIEVAGESRLARPLFSTLAVMA